MIRLDAMAHNNIFCSSCHDKGITLMRIMMLRMVRTQFLGKRGDAHGIRKSCPNLSQYIGFTGSVDHHWGDNLLC